MEGVKIRTQLVNVENLRIAFKKNAKETVEAVKGVSFQINQGETLAIVGESGCGKSVTAMSMMKLISPNDGFVEGDIQFGEININRLTEKQMRDVRGNDISMIFQEPMTSLNPVHKIGEQISEVLKIHHATPKKMLKQESIAMLKKVGIPRPDKVVDEYPHQLSGGMRQRVMIAMAMACEPKLLIADEPTTALDVTIQAQILDLMNDLKEKMNTSILLITHDLGVVAEVADRVIVMYYGQIVEEADVHTLFKEPKHPYTVGLMNSIPNIHSEEDERLEPIVGNVPNIGVVKQGCPFRFRCKDAFSKCAEDNPPIFRHDQQGVRCWLYEEGGVVQ